MSKSIGAIQTHTRMQSTYLRGRRRKRRRRRRRSRRWRGGESEGGGQAEEEEEWSGVEWTPLRSRFGS
eukprot:6496698-Pyramimonas_sp.AAC.1